MKYDPFEARVLPIFGFYIVQFRALIMTFLQRFYEV